jgi:hypothetical protein
MENGASCTVLASFVSFVKLNIQLVVVPCGRNTFDEQVFFPCRFATFRVHFESSFQNLEKLAGVRLAEFSQRAPACPENLSCGEGAEFSSSGLGSPCEKHGDETSALGKNARAG